MNKVMNKKVSPIGECVIEDLTNAHDLYSKFMSIISNRVNYIVREIASLFKGEVNRWDWGDGSGEIEGHFTPNMVYDDSIQLDGERKGTFDDEWVAFLKDENGQFTNEWEFHWFEFPTRFLYEDFEEELKEGIQKYKEHQVKKEMKKLIDSVKSKLTPEERKALGV